MSKDENGKLMATALSAAAAGAGLAVLAMKMIESATVTTTSNNSGAGGDGGATADSIHRNNSTNSLSKSNLLRYHSDDARPIRPAVIMNDPSDLVDSLGGGRRDSTNSAVSSAETVLFPHNHEEKMRRRIATRYTIEEENNLGRDSVTVRVPATSANVGPGCTFFIFISFIYSLCIIDVLS